jgi:putative aldouronate transport system substrate-binding protein
MKKTRVIRMLVIILSLALILTAFSGCRQSNTPKDNPAGDDKPTGNVDSTGNDSQEETDQFAEFRPDKDKVYEIRKANWIPGPVDNENGDMIKYYEENLNARIISENLEAAQFSELLSLKIASDEAPDVFQIRSYAEFQTYYENQVLYSFSEELFKEFAPNIYQILENESPNAFSYTRLDGENLYGVAGVRFHNQFVQPVVWRQDWLKNVGIESIPETLEEVEEALYKFTREDPDQNGKDDTYGISQWGIDAILSMFGYCPMPFGSSMIWTDRDGELVYSGVQPEMKEALQLLNKWYNDGIIDPEFITSENKGGDGRISHSFINGRIGFTSGQEYFAWSPVNPLGMNIVEFKNTNPDAPEDAIAVTLPPKGKNGVRSNYQWPEITPSVYGFSKNLEKEPDKFGKILEVFNHTLSNYDNYLTSWFGIQGEHWDMVDGQPTSIGIYTDNSERTRIGAYTHMAFNLEPDIYWGVMFQERTDWAKNLGLDTDAVGHRNKLLAALPSMNKYQAELIKIRQEAYISIITGDKPVDFFDEFVETWNASEEVY